jgi:hypothetical protein
MQCCEVVELLSEYYDGELSPDKADAVAEHVAVCTHCAAELETLHKLSDLTRKLDQPSPPRHVWPRIAAQLNSSQSPVTVTAVSAQRASRKMLLAVAAMLLVGLSWIAYTKWQAREHHHLAVNFGHFLDLFQQAPDEAQQELVEHYSGQPVEIADAIRELKYRPVVANGLPDDYEPAQAYLLKMPCCRCLEACYHRKDGGMLCVFEHDIDQPVWFGDRPVSSKVCSGKPTRLVQVDGCLAATWQQERRHITVIGVKDVDEVTRLVAHFDAHPTSELKR